MVPVPQPMVLNPQPMVPNGVMQTAAVAGPAQASARILSAGKNSPDARGWLPCWRLSAAHDVMTRPQSDAPAARSRRARSTAKTAASVRRSIPSLRSMPET